MWTVWMWSHYIKSVCSWKVKNSSKKKQKNWIILNNWGNGICNLRTPGQDNSTGEFDQTFKELTQFLKLISQITSRK